MTNLPDWAQDATLGVFIHWGAYSVPAWAEPSGALGAVSDGEWYTRNAYAEWYANTIRIDESAAALHHLHEHDGAPYSDFLDVWRAESYDPADWARLFAALGADYVVPTTKHHDGITLWPPPTGSGLDTVERGPTRDLITPLADAVRAEGMRFGVYYSGGLDWSFSDLPPIRSNADLLRLRPTGADYNAYAFSHVADLIDRYRPDVLWNDIEWPDAGKVPGPHSLSTLFARYRAAVPEGIVNDRWGIDVGDYRTSEYDTGTAHQAGAGWEHCRGLGLSFGYNRLEDEALTLAPRELARLYADIVSRGGRLLLNVGPTASGEIPAVQRRTLEGVAEWMRAIKPLTHGRCVLIDDRRAALEVSGTKWWCAWEVPDGIVVVIDGPAASARVRSDRAVTVVSLPD